MSSVEVETSKAIEVLAFVQGLCKDPQEGMLVLLGAVHLLDLAYRTPPSTHEEFIAQTISVLNQYEHGTPQ